MIEKGTRLILIAEDGNKYITRAEPGMIEVRRLGVLDGDAMCAASFGEVLEVGGRRFVIAKPSITDLITALDRKAQIIMPKDGYIIPMYLDIACGSKVVEAGAGSGALTLILLKAVAPEGSVCSYELREDHAKIARKNVEMAGYGACWDLRIEDICHANLEKDLDAAVLDMPNPWDALPNVCRALRPGGYVCCYVPNMNQLEEAVKAMRKEELSEVHSLENLQREIVVHEGGVRPSSEMIGHTGYMTFGRKTRR